MGRNRPKRNREFWESAFSNNSGYLQYYYQLLELSISMWKYENLPDTIDPRFLELTLFADGKAIFFKDEDLGYLTLRCITGAPLDVYNIPIYRQAYANNGYHINLDNEDSVIIWNNMSRQPSMFNVEQFARRLWKFDRVIDVNVNAQKTPILIVCDETQRLTMKNLYKQYDGNEPVIYGDSKLNVNALSVLKTDAPYNSDKIYELKTQYFNEALTYLGISNINYQKKERMITDEVARNLGGTIANRYSRLNARQQALDDVNKMFGLDIHCYFNEDYEDFSGDLTPVVDDEIGGNKDKGGDDNV